MSKIFKIELATTSWTSKGQVFVYICSGDISSVGPTRVNGLLRIKMKGDGNTDGYIATSKHCEPLLAYFTQSLQDDLISVICNDVGEYGHDESKMHTFRQSNIECISEQREKELYKAQIIITLKSGARIHVNAENVPEILKINYKLNYYNTK